MDLGQIVSEKRFQALCKGHSTSISAVFAECLRTKAHVRQCDGGSVFADGQRLHPNLIDVHR